jgi:hypothetical protein
MLGRRAHRRDVGTRDSAGSGSDRFLSGAGRRPRRNGSRRTPQFSVFRAIAQPSTVRVAPPRSAGFGSVLPEDPELSWASDRFTAVPLETAITSGSDFTGAFQLGIRTTTGFVDPVVQATVRRASPPPTGRCQSSCTGVGVLPGLGERLAHHVVRCVTSLRCSRPSSWRSSRRTISQTSWKPRRRRIGYEVVSTAATTSAGVPRAAA